MWIASYERMLGLTEIGKYRVFEKDFMKWVLKELPKASGYSNINPKPFKRFDRILAIDVEFESRDVLFPGKVPTFDTWVVIQVKPVKSEFSELKVRSR